MNKVSGTMIFIQGTMIISGGTMNNGHEVVEPYKKPWTKLMENEHSRPSGTMMNVYGTMGNFDWTVRNSSGTMYNEYKTMCN